MGHYENQQKAQEYEREKVRAGRANPNTLNTIGGKMEYDRWKANLPTPRQSSVSSPTPAPTFPDQFPTRNKPLFGNPPSSPRLTAPTSTFEPPKPHVTDWTDRLMQRIPRWCLAACTIIGAFIGLGLGAAAGGATAVVYSFVGAFVGLIAIPVLIKVTQLALRILAVAAVVGILFLAFRVLTHANK